MTTTRKSPGDDRRYMPHEVRAIDDPRYRGTLKRPTEEGTATCTCGKTVLRYNGAAVSVACPRACGGAA